MTSLASRAFVCALVLAACLPRDWRRLEEPQVRALEGPEPIFVLERSACYGKCPQYRVIVRGDGRVTYEGFNHVDTEGSAEGRADPKQVKALAEELERAGYFDWPADCCVTVYDAPSEMTWVRHAGRVGHQDCIPTGRGPKTLEALGRRIDELAGAKEWTGKELGAPLVSFSPGHSDEDPKCVDALRP